MVRKQDMSYIEAVVNYVEKSGIEFEKVNKLLNKSLRDKLENEALDLNMFPDKKKSDVALQFDEEDESI